MGFTNVDARFLGNTHFSLCSQGVGGIEPLPVSLSGIRCKRGHELPSPCCDGAALQESEHWGQESSFCIHSQEMA